MGTSHKIQELCSYHPDDVHSTFNSAVQLLDTYDIDCCISSFDKLWNIIYANKIYLLKIVGIMEENIGNILMFDKKCNEMHWHSEVLPPPPQNGEFGTILSSRTITIVELFSSGSSQVWFIEGSKFWEHLIWFSV